MKYHFSIKQPKLFIIVSLLFMAGFYFQILKILNHNGLDIDDYFNFFMVIVVLGYMVIHKKEER